MTAWWARITATYCYVGYIRPASGTGGSLAALPLAYALAALHPMLFFVAIPATYVKGLVATRIYRDSTGDHDPSEVVIDEVVGQWIALLPVVVGAWASGSPLYALWPGWVTAFIAFRIFDIWKPWLVGRADARGDAVGVMLDDVWAGAFGAIAVLGVAWLFHGGL